MAGANVAINIEGLGKSYLIGHQADHRYETFREMLGRRLGGLVRGIADVARGRQIVAGDEIEEFWALDDVSFEVRRGEVMGVIGRNGAGKSTLLKVLSRITEPTKGRAVIRGRVASLLEVGTGFHPELTGRENIFLNGAILGMTRAEILARFDEIVAFAEIDRFLDTPVKRYSSGMYVRLAFAVAAHLDPEILIIDEVLAVGDIAFQKKCLGKMQDVAQHGRTVLFVSHNLPAVMDLTHRAVMIEKGKVAMVGETRQVVSAYLRSLHSVSGGAEDVAPYRRDHREVGFVDIQAVRICGMPPGAAVVPVGGSIELEFDLLVHRPVEGGVVNFNILNGQMEVVAGVMSADAEFFYAAGPGVRKVRCELQGAPLMPGEYLLDIGAGPTGGGLSWDVLEALPAFRVDGAQSAAWLKAPDRPGVLLIDNGRWT